MSKEQIILVPKTIENNSFFIKNKLFICFCCDISYKPTYFCTKKNKCEFCTFNNFSKKNTIVFTIKQFLTILKINKTYFYNSIIIILNKYKFITVNWETLMFFINTKNINDNKLFKHYLNFFFEELFQFLNIEKIFNLKKDLFVKTYVNAICSFKEKNKRPLGKVVLIPFFNNKIFKSLNKREVINSKNILVLKK